ncbi:hypothetical protein [Stappia sp. TSB10GB4]|uniref:hypothetical protein n=1 Tax=Stappia sp. TSB10GB4 TaxID=2003584 RepID=UPI0016446613|nr:hypothetical protein [Stappia sp. TSB10GB4]
MAIRLLPFLALLLAVAPAAADTTAIEGRYGDAEGCALTAEGAAEGAEGGAVTGADFFFLMDDEGISTAVSYCAFSPERRMRANGLEILAQCHEEGEEEVTPFTLTLRREGEGYLVAFPDGMTWGPLMRCAP